MLPFQARAFHRALERTGISSELLYVPGESHISEMLSITHEDDPSAQAILKFIQ
jgi:dipeptidyl aminopeptidase/acylaminoacyl peptidase